MENRELSKRKCRYFLLMGIKISSLSFIMHKRNRGLADGIEALLTCCVLVAGMVGGILRPVGRFPCPANLCIRSPARILGSRVTVAASGVSI